MAGPAPIFREIHRLRRYARDLQEQLDRIPRQRQARQALLQKQTQGWRDTQEAVKKLKVTTSDKEKTIKTKQEQITRYERQINEINSKKEYDALLLEIAHTKEAITQLEDEALAAMMDGDERAAQLPALEAAAKQAQAELSKFEAEVSARQADLAAQLAEAQGQLKLAEAKVPPDLLPQYNRTIASLGADGLAEVRDRGCTACYTEVNSQKYRDLENEQFVVCPQCGRILYLPAAARKAADEGE